MASATLGLPQVYNTFARWRQRGVRDVLLALLRQQARAKAGGPGHAAHRFLRRSLTIRRLAEKAAARRVGEYLIDTSNDPSLE